MKSFCAACGRHITVPDHYAGRPFKCPKCGMIIQAAALATMAAPAPPLAVSKAQPPAPAVPTPIPPDAPPLSAPVMRRADQPAHIPYATSLWLHRDRSNPWKGLGIAAVCILSMIGMGTVMHWMGSSSSTASNPSSPSAPAIAPPPPPPRIRVANDISGEEVYEHIHGRKISDAWRIRNDSNIPITIQIARFNGEFDAVPATYTFEDGYIPAQSGFPVTLTIGESVLIYQYNLRRETPYDYRKDVVYLDVQTDQGFQRFKP